MDVLKAEKFKDAILLSLVFVGSFFLANTFNATALIVYQEKIAKENPQTKVRDWLVYLAGVIIFFILFIYILRSFY